MSLHTGDRVRLRAVVTNYDDQVADPSSVVFTVRNPDGTPTVLTYGVDDVTRDSVGNYFVRYLCEIAGRHNWAVVVSGAIDAYAEATFIVRPQRS